MRRWDPLNEQQLNLLKRVDAAEDLSGPEHSRLRHSANAVRDRGLITISKRGGIWRATMTEAGRFYLDHGHHPADPRYAASRQEAEPTAGTMSTIPRQHPQRADKVSNASGSKVKRPAPRATVMTTQRRHAEATELVTRLIADQLVVINAPTDDEISRWRKTVDFAKRHNLVPEGYRIEKIRQWNRDRDLHIQLLKGNHTNTKHATPDLPRVAVPDSLRSPHPVVAGLRDDSGRLVMSKELRRRCLLILQGLAAEATQRGHKITKRPVSEHHHIHYYGYPRDKDTPPYSRREGELNIIVNDFSYPVTIQQVSPQSEDPEKAQRLVIELSTYHSEGRQCRWADGKRRVAEDGLAALLREVETRAVEDQKRQLDEEWAKADRKVRWEQAMKVAKQKAIEANYAKVLDAQVERWQRAKKLQAYREALEHRLAKPRSTDGDLSAAREWLDWITQHVTRTDPTESPPTMPPPPTLRHEDLTPYLNGWSPYGPEAHLSSPWQRR